MKSGAALMPMYDYSLLTHTQAMGKSRVKRLETVDGVSTPSSCAALCSAHPSCTLYFLKNFVDSSGGQVQKCHLFRIPESKEPGIDVCLCS